MKKLLLAVATAALLFPLAVLAGHMEGMFHSYGNDHMIITDPAHDNAQVRLGHSGKVAIVDHTGAAVDHHALRAGHPVTVHYSGEGDHRVVSRVVIHKQTTTTH
jgi:hypothetical protein